MSDPLLRNTERGLHCPAGDFFVDPWGAVDRAVITHAHSDHARAGSRAYLAAAPGAELLRLRLGAEANIQSVPFGEPVIINGVTISLHPAGHILGSAQVRIEHRGEVWVVSGDYKTEPDATSGPFEPMKCHTFITESTFGLPIYRWRPQETVFKEINDWWRDNQHVKRSCVIFCYALGKSQRVLSGLDASIGPIIGHGAVTRYLEAYEAAGIKLPPVLRADPEVVKATRGKAMVLAPPSAVASPWLRKFGPISTAFASGWMQVRGTRRRGNVDRGFVLSDHADWDGLLGAIHATGAANVAVTHGRTETLTRWLKEHGLNAWAYDTRFSDEEEESLENNEDAPAQNTESVPGPGDRTAQRQNIAEDRAFEPPR